MIEIRLLLAGDDRTRFESGDRFLDAYFHRYAGQNQFRHRIGATYVAIESGTICGFVTVAPGVIQIEQLSVADQARLPRYPIPVLRIARLAVGSTHQRLRIGEALLGYALRLALRTGREIGCAGVLVDAKPKAVAFYENYGFRQTNTVEGELRNAPVSLFLGIHSIPDADPEEADRAAVPGR